MSKDCIVIIDPQKDFTSRQGAYAQRHAGISQIEQSLENIRALLARRKDLPLIIIYSDYSKGQFGGQLSMCIPGTEGHLIDIQFDQPSESFSKSVHSAFSSPAFSSYLRQQGFERILLGGFLAEYCVHETALDGLGENFGVLLLQDCIGTGDDAQERKYASEKELHQKGALLISSSGL